MEYFKVQTPFEVRDELYQTLTNMHVDLCLIEAIRLYGGDVCGFDEGAREMALDWSMERMAGYYETFMADLDYCQSYEYVSQRYAKLTGALPSDLLPPSD